MAAVTSSASLTSAAYSLIATAPWAVKIICVSPSSVRFAIAASLPAAESDNWYPITSNQPFEMVGITGANVYARSEGATAFLRVIAA